MSATTEHPDIEAFTTACRAAGVQRLALCWRREWGPPQLAAGDPGDYDHREELRLLAYAAGEIHVCEPRDVERDALAEDLRAAGFSVELRNRNLGAE